MLGRIKELFPGAAIHAYTATATEQVRRDICTQLGLADPLVLVGNFDRPNLTYRVLPRMDLAKQVREVLERHQGEAGIIYCMRRRDVDDTNALLQRSGYKSLAYHAGMASDERQRVQEAFAEEECDLIVATVAFGMGIDRSNIRFVLHTAMPKSIEHYQQETGRAGRDGLEAECVLLYSGGDVLTWKAILEKSATENDVGPDFLPNAIKHLDDMDRYARGAVCRHRRSSATSARRTIEPSCGACDMCLGDVEARRLTRSWSRRRSCRAWPASRNASASATSSASCAARTPSASAICGTTSSAPSACCAINVRRCCATGSTSSSARAYCGRRATNTRSSS